MTDKEINDLVSRYVAKIEDEQKDNEYKFAYLTGMLEAHLKSALCGERDMVIRIFQKHLNTPEQ